MEKRQYSITDFFNLKKFYKRLMGHDRWPVPAKIESQFNVQFSSAINTEWQENGDYLEALFFIDNSETIARYDCDGRLMEVRTNLDPAILPEKVRRIISSDEEIMNGIKIEKEGVVNYELIVRKKDFSRMLLLVGLKGDLVKESLL